MFYTQWTNNDGVNISFMIRFQVSCLLFVYANINLSDQNNPLFQSN